jgi:hypothetical protein
VTLLKEVG